MSTGILSRSLDEVYQVSSQQCGYNIGTTMCIQERVLSVVYTEIAVSAGTGPALT